jgi:ribosomal-protein-alanine N-acetyltransferase
MMQLETPGLILRRPQGSDLPAYRAYCLSERTRFTGGPYKAAQATEKLAAMIGHWYIRGYGRLFFCDRRTGRAMGHVGALHLVDEEVPEMTWTIWSDTDEGQGLAHEAARAYLDHVRLKGQFLTLLAHIEPENHRSRQLALRLGAVFDPSAPAPGWMPNGLTYRFEL